MTKTFIIGLFIVLCSALTINTPAAFAAGSEVGCRVREGALGAGAIFGGVFAGSLGMMGSVAIGIQTDGVVTGALAAYLNTFGLLGMWAPAILGVAGGVALGVWGLSRLYNASLGDKCAVATPH